jgi:hypothetical protein
MDDDAFNYSVNANVDDGSCIPVVFGCIDPTAFNYCDTCNTDNGGCIPTINGCTDNTAINYNALANTDNGSCIYPLPGCTDPTAVNYNAEANVADSSCYYSAGCASGDVYYIPDACFEWVIDIDPYCCDDQWDYACDDLYAYCQDGWSGPTSLDELIAKAQVYPNPVKSFVRINKIANVKLYDITGKVTLEAKQVNIIDVSALTPGVYSLHIEINSRILKHKIIKQ